MIDRLKVFGPGPQFFLQHSVFYNFSQKIINRQRHCLCTNFHLSTSNDSDPSKYATLFFRIHNENSPSDTTNSKKGTYAGSNKFQNQHK
jgi:hypothetical protein